MSNTEDLVHLQPAPGLRVMDPATGEPLPSEGAAVVMGTYWHRRLLEGDVKPLQARAQRQRKAGPSATNTNTDTNPTNPQSEA